MFIGLTPFRMVYESENGTSWYFFAPEDEELKQLLEMVLQCETLKRDMHLERNGATAWELMFPDDSWWEDE
jgi:hypothetical protein